MSKVPVIAGRSSKTQVNMWELAKEMGVDIMTKKKNPAKNKLRGSTFERKLVNMAKDLGLQAERAYASNGNAFGEVQEVDVKVSGYRIQAKRRAKLAKFLDIDEGVDMVVFRRDHGEDLVLVPYEKVLEWIIKENYHDNTVDTIDRHLGEL